MKVLFFSSYFYPYISGLTTTPYKILKYLGQNNNITVFTFSHDVNLPKTETVDDIKIIRLPYFFKISKGFISPQSLFYFYKEALRSELIILNIPNFEGLPLAILGKIFNKKIISIFNCQVHLGNGLISKFTNFFLNLSVFFQLSLSNKIITYTKDYINSLTVGKLFASKIYTCLPPIIRLEISKVFLKKLIRKKDGKVWVGFCGRISKEKGIEYLIEAVSLLDKNNIKIVFAGPYGNNVAGEKNYFDKIKKLLEEKKINYLFLGNLTNDDLGAFYKTIDVLVLPSINQTEAFGIVQAEAMLLGTPVVATNLPGVKQSIKLTKMGLIVNPKNSRQLSQAIIKILRNKSSYSNKQLVKKAKDIFNIAKIYNLWNKII